MPSLLYTNCIEKNINHQKAKVILSFSCVMQNRCFSCRRICAFLSVRENKNTDVKAIHTLYFPMCTEYVCENYIIALLAVPPMLVLSFVKVTPTFYDAAYWPFTTRVINFVQQPTMFLANLCKDAIFVYAHSRVAFDNEIMCLFFAF
jgi:hypothetical protein